MVNGSQTTSAQVFDQLKNIIIIVVNNSKRKNSCYTRSADESTTNDLCYAEICRARYVCTDAWARRNCFRSDEQHTNWRNDQIDVVARLDRNRSRYSCNPRSNLPCLNKKENNNN